MTGHNLSLKIRRTRKAGFCPLDPDDAGETDEKFSLSAREQNDAFRAAMLRAIARGKERVKEETKVADPTEIRTIARPFVASHVITASSLNDL